MQRLHVLGLALVAAALTACARGDDTAAANVTQSGAADGPRVVAVDGHDFAFTAPDTISAGWTTFRFTNHGPALHHAMIVRLDSGKTMADVAKVFAKPGPMPGWLVFVGGPNAPAPGTEANATMEMAPGHYALLCLVDVPDGVPHLMKGMSKAFTVVPASGAMAAAPVATDSITLADYVFKLSRPLTAGTRTFRVVANAQQPHEIELVKLAPGKTAADMMKWMEKFEGPPPGQAIGGTAPSAPGVPVYFTADITAGDYMLICFVPGPDGKPHFLHGMMTTQHVD